MSMVSSYVSYILAFVLFVATLYLLLRLQTTRADWQAVRIELDRCQLTLELSEDVGCFGSWDVDAKSNLVEWSDYVFDMHERRRSLGQPPLEDAIPYYHPDDRPMVQDAVSLALDEGMDFEYRARILTENRNELPVLSRGTCQIYGDGAVLGIFGCFVDLSTPEERRFG